MIFLVEYVTTGRYTEYKCVEEDRYKMRTSKNGNGIKSRERRNGKESESNK